MGTRVSYPYELKMKAIEMRLSGIPVKQVLTELNIRHKTQVETWMRWYKNGEL
ncbi:IS3 family transposase, partial [Viridibacillus arvi]